MKNKIKLLVFIGCALFLSCYEDQVEQVRMMTYNIRYSTPNDGPNWWEKRKEKVFELINEQAPDVLGVQEAVHSQMIDLDSFLINYNYFGIGRADGKTGGEYAAIFYKKNKFNFLDGGTFWLSEKPEEIASVGWDASMERICTWVKLELNNSKKSLFIFNAHFDHIGKEARKNSVILIMEKINKIAENAPVVFMGDLNFAPEEEPYQVVLKNKLKDTYKKDGKSCTYTGFEVKGHECRRIDYIFINDSIKVENFSIDDRNDGIYFPSDHLPVIADVVF